jgi:hypothetical protein
VRPTHQHLVETRVANFRPTQMTVGLAEVELKRKQWRQLDKKERARQLALHWFPCVIGPKEKYYIVDHHHLGFALHQEGIDTAWAMVLNDFSMLEAARFWRVMEFHQWAHPYNERGNRCDYNEIPKSVTDLRDDPYRSLSGFVRDAGGFAKDTTPFAEFLWADYFRDRIDAKLIDREPEKAVREALATAHSQAARYLPGWTAAHAEPTKKPKEGSA